MHGSRDGRYGSLFRLPRWRMAWERLRRGGGGEVARPLLHLRRAAFSSRLVFGATQSPHSSAKKKLGTLTDHPAGVAGLEGDGRDMVGMGEPRFGNKASTTPTPRRNEPRTGSPILAN